MLNWLMLWACQGDKASDSAVPLLQSGAPIVGVAEGRIDVPIGTPMGGYSNRCFYLGGASTIDDRESAYAQAFTPSTGSQTAIMAEALWLENGDQPLIMLTIDAIYSNDGLVREVERQIQTATGEDVYGKVIISASHTHHAPANYTDQLQFYLGGDRYNEEIFQRYATSLANLVIDAYNSKVPAKIGFGLLENWDPEDLVYRDRRPENDNLGFWEDINGSYKDPQLWMLRVDDLNDNPMGVFFNFGIHGTSLGASNPLFSVDAPGHLEFAFQEYFDQPVVVGHFQGGAGDISPGGLGLHGHPYARMEGISEFAATSLYELWSTTPTSSDPFILEIVTRSISQGQEEIHVTRDGTVDWHYLPFQEDYVPDEQIFDADGNIISPLDEFNTDFGAVFCGYEEPFLSTGAMGATTYPYNGCTKISIMSTVLYGVFNLSEFFPDGFPLPMPASTKAQTSSLKLGPVSIKQADGSIVQEDIFMGFFPGEATSYYRRHYQDRVQNELGLSNVILGDYAQDHEGYLLIPEDWLAGGYEPNINIWGPLQAEHIMEGNLEMSSLLQTVEREDPNPNGEFDSTVYSERPLPTATPDQTLLAGTVAETLSEDIYTPLDIEVTAQPNATLPRVQGLAQFTWEGGDPAVDNPTVLLEYKDAAGNWIEVQTASGRTVDDTMPDILLTHTPTPLAPFESTQGHQWWAGWQTVAPTSPNSERMGLPVGEYRFHVYGHHFTGDESTYPWSAEEYDVTSTPFSIEPAEITLSIDVESDSVRASIQGPEWGYRLVDIDGSATGANPPLGVTLTLHYADGSTATISDGTLDGQEILFSEIDLSNIDSIEATDVFNNQGVWTE